MKKGSCFLVVLMACVFLSGCTYTAEVVEKDTSTPVMETEYESGQTVVCDVIRVADEPFSLACTYDTGDYLLDKWRVTANKSINMTVNTKGLPEGYTVHVEHVHADIILKSTEPQIDGITQDSMDDSDHRMPTNGFLINDSIAYNNVFAIEGYTDQFYTLWGYAFGSYGSMSSSYSRLTELNIRKVGTYAEKLMVVYDIVITTPECQEGYVKSVYSEVLIPLTSEIETVQKDLLTGEVIEPSTEN